jgi:hypothetical protein
MSSVMPGEDRPGYIVQVPFTDAQADSRLAIDDMGTPYVQ